MNDAERLTNRLKEAVVEEPKTGRTVNEAEVRALEPWFHNMWIGGVRTAPDHFLDDYPAVKYAHFKAGDSMAIVHG